MIKYSAVFVLVLSSLHSYAQESQNVPKHNKAIIWRIDDPARVGGFKPSILGQPLIMESTDHKALLFDGIDDGLIVPEIPIQGWTRFSIEVLFKPPADGPIAPRFVHFQDKDNRGTFERYFHPILYRKNLNKFENAQNTYF